MRCHRKILHKSMIPIPQNEVYTVYLQKSRWLRINYIIPYLYSIYRFWTCMSLPLWSLWNPLVRISNRPLLCTGCVPLFLVGRISLELHRAEVRRNSTTCGCTSSSEWLPAAGSHQGVIRGVTDRRTNKPNFWVTNLPKKHRIPYVHL